MTLTLLPRRCLFRTVPYLLPRIRKTRRKTFWTTFSLSCVSRQFFLPRAHLAPHIYTLTWRFGAGTTLYDRIWRSRTTPACQCRYPFGWQPPPAPMSRGHFDLTPWRVTGHLGIQALVFREPKALEMIRPNSHFLGSLTPYISLSSLGVFQELIRDAINSTFSSMAEFV